MKRKNRVKTLRDIPLYNSKFIPANTYGVLNKRQFYFPTVLEKDWVLYNIPYMYSYTEKDVLKYEWDKLRKKYSKKIQYEKTIACNLNIGDVFVLKDVFDYWYYISEDFSVLINMDDKYVFFHKLVSRRKILSKHEEVYKIF